MFRHVSKIALKYTTSIFSQPQEQQQQNISDMNSIELVELKKGLVSLFFIQTFLPHFLLIQILGRNFQ